MKKSLRIIIFNWRDPLDPMAGGAERVTLKHAEYWVEMGHEVTWVSGVFPGAKSEEVRGGIRYIRNGNSKLLFLTAWWIFWRKLHGEFDVILDEVHGLPMFSPLWAPKKKILVLIHEVAQEIWSEMFPFPVSTIGKFIEKYIFPMVYQATPFWVDCESTKKDLVMLEIPEENVTIVPCAIDPIPEITPQKRSKKLTCIFVARLVKMKGIEYAIETFAKIHASEPTARLWLVGTGESEYVETLKQKMCEHKVQNHVKFWGKVSEVKKFELLAQAHILLHTSVREGFGLTILEANSQNTPVAVFNVAALRDLVTQKNGIIVSFGDTAAMADQVLKVWNDQTRYLKLQKAAYTFSQHFRWRTFTRQSEKMLHL